MSELCFNEYIFLIIWSFSPSAIAGDWVWAPFVHLMCNCWRKCCSQGKQWGTKQNRRNFLLDYLRRVRLTTVHDMGASQLVPKSTRTFGQLVPDLVNSYPIFGQLVPPLVNSYPNWSTRTLLKIIYIYQRREICFCICFWYEYRWGL